MALCCEYSCGCCCHFLIVDVVVWRADVSVFPSIRTGSLRSPAMYATSASLLECKDWMNLRWVCQEAAVCHAIITMTKTEGVSQVLFYEEHGKCQQVFTLYSAPRCDVNELISRGWRLCFHLPVLLFCTCLCLDLCSLLLLNVCKARAAGRLLSYNQSYNQSSMFVYQSAAIQT